MALCDNDLIMAGAVTTVVSRPGDVFSLQFDTYNATYNATYNSTYNAIYNAIYNAKCRYGHTYRYRYNLPQ